MALNSKTRKKRSPKVSHFEPSTSRRRRKTARCEDAADGLFDFGLRTLRNRRIATSDETHDSGYFHEDFSFDRSMERELKSPRASSRQSKKSYASNISVNSDDVVTHRNRLDTIEESQQNTMADEDRERYFVKMTDLFRKNPKSFKEHMFRDARQGHSEKVEVVIEVLECENVGPDDADTIFINSSGDTLLQTTLHHGKRDIFDLIIQKLPYLIFQTTGPGCPTVLHVAVAMGDHQAVEILFDRFHRLARKQINKKIDNVKETKGRNSRTFQLLQSCNENHSLLLQLLHMKVENKLYTDTCMEGELPLAISVWNTDITMCRLLIQNGAKLDAQSSCGDTVFHQLVRLSVKAEAKENETRMEDLINTFYTLIEEVEGLITTQLKEFTNGNEEFQSRRSLLLSQLFSSKNREQCTPLALAARLGAPEMFNLIINVQNVYRFFHNTNGVSDVYYYDITDIDSATVAKNSKSVLDCIPDNSDIVTAFKFVEMMPISQVIHFKWATYSKLFFTWMFVHLCMMISLTTSATYRPVFFTNLSTNASNTNQTVITDVTQSYQSPTDFVRLVFEILVWLYGIILLIIELVSVARTRHIPLLSRVVLNDQYQIVTVLFSLCLLASFLCRLLAYQFEHIPLILSLITGWMFMLFFTRGIRKFSYFTALIHKVIFGDLLRFSVLIIILLVSFSAALHLLHKQAVDVSPEFRTFWLAMFSLFQLALGLGEIEVLYSSPSAELSVTLFVIFVILAYVLSMNMLIAMVSESCAVIASTKVTQWKLQKLNIILMLEKRIPNSWQVQAGNAKLAETFAMQGSMVGNDDVNTTLSTSAAHALGGVLRTSRERSSNTRHFFQVKTNTAHHIYRNGESVHETIDRSEQMDIKSNLVMSIKRGSTQFDSLLKSQRFSVASTPRRRMQKTSEFRMTSTPSRRGRGISKVSFPRIPMRDTAIEME